MPQLTEDQQNAAIQSLASLVGKPAAEIETILTSDNPAELQTQVTARITAIRKAGHDAGMGQLQKAANKKAKELFGIELTEAPDSVETLMEAIREGYKPQVDPATLTEEQVKQHPTFRQLETNLKTKDADHKKALEEKEKELRAELQFEKLKGRALEALKTYGAVLSEDAKLEAYRQQMYLDKLKGIETKEVDGKLEFWRDGKRVENENLFPKTEEEFFKELVEGSYTVKVSEQRSSSGAQQQQSGSSGNGFQHFKGQTPKTQKEYDAILLDRNKHSFEAREEVRTYWEQNQPK
ncbi:hypothetical protein DYU11_11565 [Fibrisoma montanum]|uniref:Uncharacterized protein n=1 Tax=Fibrisoma montanum TaxID=2305895 RepID=A0A418MB57_9BACT|nr:hypothetical protein [Fibrisoma montanum]RIV23612.1 hypothetical protein DYU11_11565 [Fibrisoma montanum]